MLVALLGLHALIAAAVAVAGRRLGRAAFLVCGIAPAATTLWAAGKATGIIDGQAVTETVRWSPSIGLDLAFRLDAFGLLMLTLVSGVGTLIFLYAFWYFTQSRPELSRFAATLLGFSGAMLGIVTTDNLLALFVFWELTSITSYLLIGFEHTNESARASALQALLVTFSGGLVLLAGIVVIGQAAGTYSLAAIVADPPTGAPMAVAAVLLLVGAATKSAQAPFHFWLPAAMVAPTPVSAYLHSATMVKAGVYLAARFAPVLALTTEVWQPAAVTLGVLTMLVGGYRALRQHDLKLLLAFGTVSQLGFMLALVGAGTPEATFAGAAVLLAHGIFKAALFMAVGVIDHSAGTRDLRRLSGLWQRSRGLAVTTCIAAASMASVPPLAGFVAKESALEAFSGAHAPEAFGPLWLAGIVVGSALTVAYSWRFCWGAFATKDIRGESGAAGGWHRPAVGFWAPVALLAGLSIVFGLAPWLHSPLVESATVALDASADPDPLALWHGLSLPLLLTTITFGGGALLAARARRVEQLQGALPRVPSGADTYERILRGTLRLAGRVSAVVQSGSLPVYIGVILIVAVAGPAVALFGARSAWQPARFADSPLQVVAVLIAVSAAVGVAFSRRRFPAVLALGGVGYATVTLFALHGAPDLALTQLLIETLTLVVFVLALRHLPERFRIIPWPLSQALRTLIALATGLFVAAFGLIAGAARREPTVSREFLARSVSEAGGHNIVNVILVDFRGLDTLGEITVLAIAGVGIAALVMAPRWRTRRVEDATEHERPPATGGGA